MMLSPFSFEYITISSPGGDALTAERIINLCRTYSGTNDYWVIVPAKAKSARTMICFGASKIFMGPASELGAIDPQLIIRQEENIKLHSAYNVVRSYNDLFQKAVRAKGNLEPYLQQLSKYDARDIQEYRSALELSEDIAIRTLQSGMMKGKKTGTIRRRIQRFLSPEQTKTHGRPIYASEAAGCGLSIEEMDHKSKTWSLVYDLYYRTNFLCLQWRRNVLKANAMLFPYL